MFSIIIIVMAVEDDDDGENQDRHGFSRVRAVCQVLNATGSMQTLI